MTFDQLQTFITVAESGGIRAASKLLHKTQPSISVAIKNLENELELELFDRSNYRIRLTTQGSVLLQQARKVLDEVNNVKIKANELSGGKEPELKLIIDHLCPMDTFLKMIGNYSNKCKDTQIDLDFDILNVPERKLIDEDADLALTPFIERFSEVEYEKFCDIELLPVASKKLFSTSTPLINDFLSKPQIIVKANTLGNAGFGQYPNAHAWFVSEHNIKKKLIVEGFGWGHLEKSSIKNELRKKQIINLKVKGLKNKKLPMYIARSKAKSFGPVAKELWQYIVDGFKD